ncbi:hypothetical protein [Streptomyces sp. NPDC093544]|jgi:hypothetical protein|uniref:hypothetical protein n=1 Tax=Streptomyces sp. NPDC093544 TaxID=3155200 RepID=UPI00344A2694
MLRRREPVPFAFIAEADQFRSNVTPPPRERPSASQMVGRWLIGLTVVAGIAGALIIGMPALSLHKSSADQTSATTQQSEASHGH